MKDWIGAGIKWREEDVARPKGESSVLPLLSWFFTVN